MDAYWTDPDRWPLLIRVNGEAAGFALINTHSHHGGQVERNMGEFWVARKHRRGGVGAEALRQILALHPGRWEVAIAERNLAARAFWPRAIAAAPNVRELRETAGDGEHWIGPIWTFEALSLPLAGRGQGVGVCFPRRPVSRLAPRSASPCLTAHRGTLRP